MRLEFRFFHFGSLFFLNILPDASARASSLLCFFFNISTNARARAHAWASQHPARRESPRSRQLSRGPALTLSQAHISSDTEDGRCAHFMFHCHQRNQTKIFRKNSKDNLALAADDTDWADGRGLIRSNPSRRGGIIRGEKLREIPPLTRNSPLNKAPSAASDQSDPLCFRPTLPARLFDKASVRSALQRKRIVLQRICSSCVFASDTKKIRKPEECNARN